MAFFDVGQPIEATKFGLASVQDFCSGGDLDQLPDIAADVMKKRYQWFKMFRPDPLSMIGLVGQLISSQHTFPATLTLRQLLLF